MNTAAIPTHTLFQNLTSQEFGRLTVIGFAGYRLKPNGKKSTMWDCRCECGIALTVAASNLKSGHSTSCGCLKKEVTKARSITHGATVDRKTPEEYTTWIAIKGRCHNPKNPKFTDYGGRGIIVDPSWINNFPAFLAHIGPRPSAAHSIDRIENDGNYEPGNVRWATLETQANNKRSNITLTHNGVTMTVARWARKLEIPRCTIVMRLKRGWSDEKSLTTPIGNNHGRNKNEH